MATIGQIIALTDALKPNSFGTSEKVGWLSTLDALVMQEIINTHAGGQASSFSGYDDSTPLSRELLVPSPYDTVYRWYLESQIDLANGDIAKYNNSVSLYNSAYLTYQDKYNRDVMPLSPAASVKF